MLLLLDRIEGWIIDNDIETLVGAISTVLYIGRGLQ